MTHATRIFHETAACSNKHSTGRANIGLLLGIAATLLVTILGILTWPDYLELKLYDVRQRLFPVQTIHPDIAVVVIDDNSLQQLGRWPWRRNLLARLIDVCHEAGASQIVLDILLTDEQYPERIKPGTTDVSAYEPPPEFIVEPVDQTIYHDEELAQAIRNSKNAIVPFFTSLWENPAEASDRYIENELSQQVDNLLNNALKKGEGILGFEQVFEQIYPGRNIDYVDEEYHQLLQIYKVSRALLTIYQFGFERKASDINIPVYYLGSVTPPIPAFAEALTDSGYVSVQEDKDGSVRRIPLLGRYKGKMYKQLVFITACRALGVTGEDIDLSQAGKIVLRGTDIQIPIDEQGQMLISWTRSWNDQLNISVTQVAEIWDKQQVLQNNQEKLRLMDDLEFQLSTLPEDLSQLGESTLGEVAKMKQRLSALGERAELLDTIKSLESRLEQARFDLKQKLEGHIVLFGSVATGEAGAGARDFVVTPCDKLTPGIMVHRNILNTLLQKKFIHRPPRYLEVIVVLAMGLLMTVVSAVFRPLASGLAVVLLVGLSILVNFWLVFATWHYWFTLVSPLAAVLGSFMVVTFYRQITEGRAKRQITTRFKQYTSPAVVDRIVKSGTDVSFAGEMRELSCFFSDLAGFTTVSERLGPEKTVKVLNIYLDRMTEVLDRYLATINKFEGDGVFAFFGAPVDLPDYARLSCLAAIDSQLELGKLVSQQQSENPDFPNLKMRIGISTGNAVVGDCGSHRRFDYTAIGDTVNLAARLESANKAYGTKLMICQNTFEKARDDIEGRYLGKVRVVGKEKGVGIYEMIGPSGCLTPFQKEYSEIFEAAVQEFQQGHFSQAVKGFENCLKQRSDDKAVLLYLNTSRKLIEIGPPENFNGCLELTSK
ncbi:MAG: CHASE2 domain-containing protein [Sedimentisphaerales bacterium]|nr:CHASE2 domain-containing protein [Sedimentisphaerales bacterium]